MPKTPRRRRREVKTDYQARFALLKSGQPRVIVRKTNRFMIVQLVESDVAQDRTLMKVTSKDLLDKGWSKEKAGSLKSIHASYLTGFLLGRKLKGQVKEAVFDTGLHRHVPGSRIYAVLKGLIDSGVHVPHDPSVFPSEERFKSNGNLFKLMEEVKKKL